ncbi:MAG: bifunctional ADP-dependent NAD(P)H-hydrate dehydratase/NAD(P)H-hydrate epimerase [Bifidobacteriaceae bacterium]|nr:bifunctional ADP-dependent NAD(P)H-hydrate dehydratase/NAD(P)H-hydrate epimerase [Bifidobacteriaceae bacterium]
MISSYTAAQIAAAEKAVMADLPPGELMSRAALAAANVCLRELRRRRSNAAGGSVTLLVGTGSNGGDALFAGTHLRRRGVAVTAVATGNRVHPAGRAALEQAGGRLVTISEGGPGEFSPIERVAEEAIACDVIVDGLLGIGARGPLTGHAAGLVTTLIVEAGLAAPPRYRRASKPTVVAIDLPSGVGVDDGAVAGQVLPADITVTFGTYKPAALLPPASGLFGRIELIDLGLTPRLREGGEPAARRLEATDALELWPVPRRADHKYTRGVLGVVAGSETYPGAAVLTTSAAVATGVGMVRYLGPDRAVERVLSRRPEVVPGGGRVNAWALGPGVAPGADDQVGRIGRALEWATSGRVPTVLDAGGFQLLPAAPQRLEPWIVLTPHAGELANLLADRGVPVERSEVEARPAHYTRLAAELVGGTILLKGPATVVAGQDGSLFVQDDGVPWLATAGAGDVLTGVIGALLAGHNDSAAIVPELPPQLAALGALVHGRAGRRAAGLIDAARSQGQAGRDGRRATCPARAGCPARAIGRPISALDVVDALPDTIDELLSR